MGVSRQGKEVSKCLSTELAKHSDKLLANQINCWCPARQVVGIEERTEGNESERRSGFDLGMVS